MLFVASLLLCDSHRFSVCTLCCCCCCCCFSCTSLIAIAHFSNFHMFTNGNQNITPGCKLKRSQTSDHDHYMCMCCFFSLSLVWYTQSFSLSPSLSLWVWRGVFFPPFYLFSQIPQFISKNDAFANNFAQFVIVVGSLLCFISWAKITWESIDALWIYRYKPHTLWIMLCTFDISTAITALCCNLLYFALTWWSLHNTTECSSFVFTTLNEFCEQFHRLEILSKD